MSEIHKAQKPFKSIRTFSRDFLDWIWRGKISWITLVLVVVSWWMLVREASLLACKERDIRLLGLTLQCIGFFMVTLGLRDIRRYFGKPHPIESFQKYWRSFPSLRKTAQNVGAGALESRATVGKARIYQSGGPMLPLEKRVEILEETAHNLYKEAGQIINDHELLAAELRQAIKKENAERQETDNRLELSLTVAIAGGINRDFLAVIYFVFGIVLATAAPEMAAWFGGPVSCN